jgi:hypothetical protein
MSHVIDYNGEGKWSRHAILQRYTQHAIKAGVRPRDLSPRELVDPRRGTKWVYPVMDEIIKGIEAGDVACATLGVEFIEEDVKFPFGKILKAGTARALRRADLTPDQGRRVRRRVLGMLAAGHIPHEYREYAKLLRKVGFDAEDLAAVADRLNRGDPYVVRFYTYFERVLEGRN